MPEPAQHDTTPKAILEGQFDQVSAGEKERVARELIQKSSAKAAVLAVEPVPFLDTAIFTPMQHRLLQAIARLHGHCLSDDDVRAAFAQIRGRLVGPNLAIAVAKLLAFIPVLPDVLSGAMAYALTNTIGEVSDQYFRAGRKLSPKEIRSSFDKAFSATYHEVLRAKRDELRALFSSPDVRHQVGDLKKCYREGKIGADQVAQRCEDILRAHRASRDAARPALS